MDAAASTSQGSLAPGLSNQLTIQAPPAPSVSFGFLPRSGIDDFHLSGRRSAAYLCFPRSDSLAALSSELSSGNRRLLTILSRAL